GSVEDVSLSNVITRANNGEIEEIRQEGTTLLITPEGEDEPTQRATVPQETDLLAQLDLSQVDYNPQPENNTGSVFFQILISFLPVIIIVGALIFMMRQAQGQGNQALSF